VAQFLLGGLIYEIRPERISTRWPARCHVTRRRAQRDCPPYQQNIVKIIKKSREYNSRDFTLALYIDYNKKSLYCGYTDGYLGLMGHKSVAACLISKSGEFHDLKFPETAPGTPD